MRTTLNIDDELLEKATKVIGIKEKHRRFVWDLKHLYIQENLSPLDIEDRYFRGRSDGYHATEHTHFARAIVL